MQPNHELPHNFRRLWIFCLIGIAVIRALPLYVWFDDLKNDHDAYIALAEGWASSGTFGRASFDASGEIEVRPTAYRPPLYPYLLSWLTKMDYASYRPDERFHAMKLSFVAVALLHWILGVATCVLAMRIATKLHLSKAAVFASGILIAVDPILVRQSTLTMTETLATFLSVAFWDWWIASRSGNYRRSLLLGGLLMGLNVLCRPTAAVWLLLILLYELVLALRHFQWKIVVRAICLALATLATLSPWVIRNWIVFHKPIWATTHGGYTLLLANNPVLFEHLRQGNFGRAWDENQFHQIWGKRYSNAPILETAWSTGENPIIRTQAAQLSGDEPWLAELDDDRFANEVAVNTIKQSPTVFLKAMLVRIGWLWAFWPASLQAGFAQRLLIGSWYAAVFLIIAVSCIRVMFNRRFLEQPPAAKPVSEMPARSRVDVGSVIDLLMPAILLVVAVTVVHSIYWSNMRMRSVAMPGIYILMTYLVTLFVVQHRRRSLRS